MGRDQLLAKAVGRLARAFDLLKDHIAHSGVGVPIIEEEVARQVQLAKAEVEQQIRENLEWQQQSSR